MNKQAQRTLPVGAIPDIGKKVGTKMVSMQLGGCKVVIDHARSRFVPGALFYGRAYWRTFASAGFDHSSGPPIWYGPTTKNPFDRRAFAWGLN